MIERDLVIVGGGPAGMAAAISARENGVRDILLLERDRFLGGILNQCVHTGFGIEYFKEILTGPEYAGRFIKQVQDDPSIEVSTRSFVVRLTNDRVVTFLKPGILGEVKAKAVIMATGCRERTREMTHIPGTRPAGIFSAGFAQKLINVEGLLPGKKAVIAGSGDIGLIMARRLILSGAEVKAVIEIEDNITGLIRNAVQCIEDFEVPVYVNHKIAKIIGRDRVEAVDVVKVDGGKMPVPGSEFRVECDTVLMSVGLIPENELIEMAGAKIEAVSNTPVSDGTNKTSIPGLFVCGNAFKVYDIVDGVTRDSVTAGRMAAEFVKEESKSQRVRESK